MPELRSASAPADEVLPPWRRFVARYVHPDSHDTLRAALARTLTPDGHPLLVEIVVSPQDKPAAETLLRIVEATRRAACAPMGRVESTTAERSSAARPKQWRLADTVTSADVVVVFEAVGASATEVQALWRQISVIEVLAWAGGAWAPKGGRHA